MITIKNNKYMFKEYNKNHIVLNRLLGKYINKYKHYMERPDLIQEIITVILELIKEYNINYEKMTEKDITYIGFRLKIDLFNIINKDYVEYIINYKGKTERVYLRYTNCNMITSDTEDGFNLMDYLDENNSLFNKDDYNYKRVINLDYIINKISKTELKYLNDFMRFNGDYKKLDNIYKNKNMIKYTLLKKISKLDLYSIRYYNFVELRNKISDFLNDIYNKKTNEVNSFLEDLPELFYISVKSFKNLNEGIDRMFDFVKYVDNMKPEFLNKELIKKDNTLINQIKNIKDNYDKDAKIFNVNTYGIITEWNKRL